MAFTIRHEKRAFVMSDLSMTSSIDLEHDELTPVGTLVEERLGKRPSPATLWRWRLRGVRVRGQTVYLECVRVGGVWCSTPKAFAEFVRAQTEASTAPAAGRLDRQSTAPTRSEATVRRLETEGLIARTPRSKDVS